MPMITVVKFIENTNENSNNKVISRTLGKIGVFNSRDGALPPEQIPQPGEFWRVEIEKEVVRSCGSVGGCFVLKPISKIGYRDGDAESPDIDHLIPGGYEVVLFETSLVIIPKVLGFNWIIEKDLRHHLRDQYQKESGEYQINSFVVSLNGEEKWPLEEQGKPPTPTTIYSGT